MNVAPRFVTDIPNAGGDYFLAISRNKRSVGIDLKAPEGRDLCRRLADWADIALQSFRPGVMKRLGLDYAALSRTNRRLIYGNLSAYGIDGALAEKPGMDVAVQARSGVMRLTGTPGSDEPMRPGASLADFAGGIYLYAALATALRGTDIGLVDDGDVDVDEGVIYAFGPDAPRLAEALAPLEAT